MHRTIFILSLLFLVLPAKVQIQPPFFSMLILDNPIYTPRSELLLLHFISCHDFPFIQVFNLAASIAYHSVLLAEDKPILASGDSSNE